MQCGRCGCESFHEHVTVDQCRISLRLRLEEAQRRLGVIQAGPIKDQSGVRASEEFLRARGRGTYGPRETARTLANRVSEPITLEYYVRTVVVDGQCMGCSTAGLRHVRMSDGGRFWVCAADAVKGCGYTIGWNEDKQTGWERMPD